MQNDGVLLVQIFLNIQKNFVRKFENIQAPCNFSQLMSKKIKLMENKICFLYFWASNDRNCDFLLKPNKYLLGPTQTASSPHHSDF